MKYLKRSILSLPIVSILPFVPATAQSVVSTQVDTVVTGLSQPTTMDFIDVDDFLVLQKSNGQVRRVIGGVLQAGNVLDVAVHSRSERGLLGIAVHPEFDRNGWVYLYYTESSNGSDTSSDQVPALGNRVYRYAWDGASLIAPQLILDLPASPATRHNGGIILFGPDDKLYVVIGDLNRDGQLENFPLGPAPDDTAVILRVNDDGTAPSSNPFYDPADPTNPLGRYYAYGVRNSFGMAFDRFSGRLWDTENGPGSYDEINLVEPGFNSGWQQIMGPDARDPQGVADLWLTPGAQYSDPEFSWFDPVAPTSIAWIESPRAGCDLVGRALVGDANCEQLYVFEPNATRDALAFTSPALADLVADNTGGQFCTTELETLIVGTGFDTVTDIKNGPDGHVWVVSLRQGSIYRLRSDPALISDADGDQVDMACDCDPGDPGVYGEPLEVSRLRPAGFAPSLAWDTQVGLAGPSTVATLISGLLTEMRNDAGYASACTLVQTTGTPSVDDTRADPPAGDGYYYLVRYENTCAIGTVGDAPIAPDPRDMLDAAVAPPLCP